MALMDKLNKIAEEQQAQKDKLVDSFGQGLMRMQQLKTNKRAKDERKKEIDARTVTGQTISPLAGGGSRTETTYKDEHTTTSTAYGSNKYYDKDGNEFETMSKDGQVIDLATNEPLDTKSLRTAEIYEQDQKLEQLATKGEQERETLLTEEFIRASKALDKVKIKEASFLLDEAQDALSAMSKLKVKIAGYQQLGDTKSEADLAEAQGQLDQLNSQYLDKIRAYTAYTRQNEGKQETATNKEIQKESPKNTNRKSIVQSITNLFKKKDITKQEKEAALRAYDKLALEDKEDLPEIPDWADEGMNPNQKEIERLTKLISETKSLAKKHKLTTKIRKLKESQNAKQ